MGPLCLWQCFMLLHESELDKNDQIGDGGWDHACQSASLDPMKMKIVFFKNFVNWSIKPEHSTSCQWPYSLYFLSQFPGKQNMSRVREQNQHQSLSTWSQSFPPQHFLNPQELGWFPWCLCRDYPDQMPISSIHWRTPSWNRNILRWGNNGHPREFDYYQTWS